jgi:hypothetical protein
MGKYTLEGHRGGVEVAVGTEVELTEEQAKSLEAEGYQLGGGEGAETASAEPAPASKTTK